MNRYYIKMIGLLLFFLNIQISAQSNNALCNEYSKWLKSTYSQLTTAVGSNILSANFSNPGNLIDDNLNNAASWTAVIGGSAWIEVKDNGATGTNVYSAGSYVSFIINELDILSLGGSVTVETFLGNVSQESITNSSLLSTFLDGGKKRLGFVTTQPFDRVRLTVNSGLTLVFTINVYYVEILKPCAVAALECNESTALIQASQANNAAGHGVVIENSRSGLSGLGVGIYSNAERVVDADPNNFMTMSVNVGANASASISVRDLDEIFPAGYFAGFEISNTTLIGLELFNNSMVRTYLNGVLQETSTSSTLLLELPVLGGFSRQLVGFQTTKPFNEIRFTITQTGVNVGSTQVYHAVAKKYCEGPELECNTNTAIYKPDFPVDINYGRTGISGAVCALCSIDDPNRVIDGDPDTFSSIFLPASVANTAAIAVKNGYEAYPINTYAAFEVSNPSLLNVELLGGITVELYRNNALVQSGTGASQLISANTSIIGSSNKGLIGIVSNVEFDEARFVIQNFANVEIGTTNVYQFVIKQACEGILDCDTSTSITNPDYSVVIENSRTGIGSGVACVGCVVSAPWKAIDDDLDDPATINLVAGLVGTNGSISVRDLSLVYPKGAMAGFVVRDPNPIFEIGLLNSITISTYLDGVLQESKVGAGNLIDLNAILPWLGSGSDKRAVGFQTTKRFNEIRITYTSLVSVLTFLDVFHPFIDINYADDEDFDCLDELHAKADINQIPQGGTAIGNILNNDQGGAVTVQSATYTDASGNAVNLPLGTATGIYAEDPANPGTFIQAGMMTLQSNGSYTFVSNPIFIGSVPINYTAVDVKSNTDGANLNIEVIRRVNPTQNNGPIAQNDTGVTKKGVSMNGNLLANDSDPDGDALTVTGINQGSGTIAIGTITQVSGADTQGNPVANAGTVTILADGSFVFVPSLNFTGEIDPITYTISDGNGGAATAVLYITVLEDKGNTTFANDDANTASKGETMSGNTLNNDFDPEGDVQTVTAVRIDGIEYAVPTTGELVVNITGKGILNIDQYGNYTFVPEDDFIGTIVLEQSVCDDALSNAACDKSTLYLTSLATSVCYKPGVLDANGGLVTHVGISSLRTTESTEWPSAREGAWIALEAKTKGFVPNRLTTAEIIAIPAADLIKGMMVYNSTEDCLQINVDGAPTGWKCFNVQTCD